MRHLDINSNRQKIRGDRKSDGTEIGHWLDMC